jgi:hypothetical protein
MFDLAWLKPYGLSSASRQYRLDGSRHGLQSIARAWRISDVGHLVWCFARRILRVMVGLGSVQSQSLRGYTDFTRSK